MGSPYQDLHQIYEADDPRACGYRSRTAFIKECAVIHEWVGARTGNLLDVGCGSGLVSAPLLGAGWSVTGIDRDPVACARAEVRGLLTVEGDAAEMPFAEETFDQVLCIEFLQQFNAPLAAVMVAEMGRVLKRGGRLIAAWRFGTSPMRRAVTFSGYVSRGFKRPFIKVHNHGWDQIESLARTASLSLVRSATIFPPLGLVMHDVHTLPARCLGTSYLGLFQKTA